jgi:peptidylprolyl isomerase
MAAILKSTDERSDELEIHYSKGFFHADDLAKHLKLTGQGDSIYFQIIQVREAVKKAKSLGLTISQDDLQNYVDGFRISFGLHGAEDTKRFLSDAGATVDDLEAFCEAALLTAAVKDHLADDATVEAHFINHRARYELARISVAVVANADLAREIVMQVTEEDEDFHKLARTHSLDEATRYAGGYVGLVSRETLPAEVSAKVFNARPGEMLGPFKDADGLQLILVQELIKPELDDHLKEQIRQEIFEAWASQFVRDGIHCKP